MKLGSNEVRVWVRKGEGLWSLRTRWVGSLCMDCQNYSVQSLQDILLVLLPLPSCCNKERFLCRNLLPQNLAHLFQPQVIDYPFKEHQVHLRSCRQHLKWSISMEMAKRREVSHHLESAPIEDDAEEVRAGVNVESPRLILDSITVSNIGQL